MRFSDGLSELVLIVDDVLASARFYRDVVGLIPEREADQNWAWFWAGEPGKAQRVALHKGRLGYDDQSPLPEGERWGQVHFALHVPREKFEAAAEHVRACGVEVYGPDELRWMKAAGYYFYDPDGNLIEFWSPDPE